MAVLTVYREGEPLKVPATEGESILSALRRAGVRDPESPCGGNGTCGKCRVTVAGRGQVLACRAAVEGDCTVILPRAGAGTVIADRSGALRFPLTPADGLGAAVDIGTTTVVVHLYDRTSGALLGTRSGENAQRPFGADVISRIQYANENPDGLETLGRAIRDQLRQYLEQLCAQAGRPWAQLREVVVAANTVMEHLLVGLSPASIAAAPFTPLSLFGAWISGDLLGLGEGGRIFLAPAVAGYVGGDITAGLLASGAWAQEETVLFLDVGTNGEMALGSGREGFLCCAAAAGPAFEGAAISQGMTARDGAVSQVDLTDGGELKLTVLGDVPAAGICGSGLVDALAVMLRLGAVDETGRLLPPDEAPPEALPWLEEDEEGVRFCLTDGVAVTAADVRQLQLAKAAIAAGMDALLQSAGLEEKDVARLYLAGGFGNYIRRESAAAIGLLPHALLERILPVGNSAGQGAAELLLSQQAREELERLKGKCRYLELSGHPAFNAAFIDRMAFD